MKALEVYEALEAITKEDRRSVGGENLQFLHTRNLVTVLDSSEYHSRQNDVSRLRFVERDIASYQDQIGSYQAQSDALERKLDSWWHKLWSRQSTIHGEERALGEIRDRLKTANGDLEASRLEQQRIEELKKDLDPYVAAAGKYVTLSTAGHTRLKQLAARAPRLGDLAFDEANEEIVGMQRAIDLGYKRFTDFYNALVERGFSRDSRVVQFAMGLSGMEGEFDTIYEKAMKVDAELEAQFKEKWSYGREDLDRLKVVSSVTGLDRDVEASVGELAELFGLALEGGHSNSYTTLFEQAQCLKIPVDGALAKWTRYDTLQDALNERQWEKNTAATCYVAANLSQRDGEVVAIADGFRDLEKILVEGGRRDSIDSGLASLILLDGEGEMQERSKRFNEAFEKMVEYGWNRDTSYYSAAAVVSLLPGTVDENVQWLDDVTERLKKDGFEDVTNRALPLIGGSYRQMFSQDVVPSYISSPGGGYNPNSYDSGCGFSVGWAIAGDAIDDGSVNLSGGFIIGGLLGGLLD